MNTETEFVEKRDGLDICSLVCRHNPVVMRSCEVFRGTDNRPSQRIHSGCKKDKQFDWGQELPFSAQFQSRCRIQNVSLVLLFAAGELLSFEVSPLSWPVK